MDEINEILLRHKNRKNKKIKNKKNSFVTKILISIILLLSGLILVKRNDKLYLFAKDKILNNNINFSKIRSLYTKYLGKIIVNDNNDVKTVSKESNAYSDIIEYKSGYQLKLNTNTIHSLKSGIVVFIGSKDDFNNTIIIQGTDGVDIWYGNIETNNVKLYDYIETDAIIATSKENKLYLLFNKGSEYLKYEEYIKN